MNSVLIVDSDGKALTAMQRRLRKDFETHIALGPRLGLQRIREEGPYALVLAEFSMSEIDGIEFMAQVRKLSPESTRVLVSKAPMDASSLMRAINDGKIFHILPLSCDDDRLIKVVEEGIGCFKRISASRQNMAEVHAIFAKAVHELVCWLRSDVRDMISPVLPVLRGLCRSLRHADHTQSQTAFLLSIIGLIAMPAELLQKIASGQPLGEEERLLFASHPEHAAEWVRHLPQLSEVIVILQGYADFMRSALQPESGEKSDKDLNSALLAMVMDYRLACYEGLESGAILARMRRAAYPQAMLAAMETELAGMDKSEVEVTLDKLQPGMVLSRAVVGTREGSDVVLVPEGYELSRTTIVFLRQGARLGQVREPFFIRKMSLIPQEGSDTA
jgi:CheY-like chemotaxis protein